MSIRAVLGISIPVALLLLGLGTVPAHAQQPDSAAVRAAFDSIVTANTYTATLEEGRLTGPGADWLEARGQAVDHFLMSERHGTVQIPAVAASLYERLADDGYGPVALEIGPHAAEAANEALSEGGLPALKQLLRRYEAPVIPFLHLSEESAMAARMAEAGATIWGVDYEFIFSLPMHLDALAEQAATDRERRAVRQTRTAMNEDWGGPTGRALAAAPRLPWRTCGPHSRRAATQRRWRASTPCRRATRSTPPTCGPTAPSSKAERAGRRS